MRSTALAGTLLLPLVFASVLLAGESWDRGGAARYLDERVLDWMTLSPNKDRSREAAMTRLLASGAGTAFAVLVLTVAARPD